MLLVITRSFKNNKLDIQMKSDTKKMFLMKVSNQIIFSMSIKKGNVLP